MSQRSITHRWKNKIKSQESVLEAYRATGWINLNIKFLLRQRIYLKLTEVQGYIYPLGNKQTVLSINKQCVLMSGVTGFSLATYPSSLPLVPSSTSTLCWSGKLQFTLDSLVLPVWRVESYTLTLPTYGPARWCGRWEERAYCVQSG